MMTTFSMGRLMAVVVAVIASAVVLSAAIAAGTVNGAVTQAGNPVVGAKVKITSRSDSGYGATTSTGKDGSFTFWKSRLGDAIPIVVAHAPGYLPPPPIPAVAWGTVGKDHQGASSRRFSCGPAPHSAERWRHFEPHASLCREHEPVY